MVGYLRLLQAIDQDNPTVDLYLVADNLSSHKSPPIQAWLAEHPPPSRPPLAQSSANQDCSPTAGDWSGRYHGNDPVWRW